MVYIVRRGLPLIMCTFLHDIWTPYPPYCIQYVMEIYYSLDTPPLPWVRNGRPHTCTFGRVHLCLLPQHTYIDR